MATEQSLIPNIASESFEFQRWQSLLVGTPLVILDIGANDLGTSFAFLNLFPDSYIHAFEPDKRALAHARARLQSNSNHSDRITLHEVAVSSSNQVSQFYPSNGVNPNLPWYSSGYDLSGSLRKPLHTTYPGIESIYFDQPVEVPCMTLDTWLLKFRPRKIDLIWMDVQGEELNVILGGRRSCTMAKWIFLECMDEQIYNEQPSLSMILEQLPDHSLFESFHDGNYLFKRNW
jgi:FkbM family methyltransferase